MSFGIKTASGLQKIHSVRVKGIPVAEKNLLDPSKALMGYELSTTDGTAIQSYSGYVSDYIDVENVSKILVYRTGTWRYGWFYNSSKTAIQSFTTNGAINVPSNAKYLRTNDERTYINGDYIIALSYRNEV